MLKMSKFWIILLLISLAVPFISLAQDGSRQRMNRYPAEEISLCQRDNQEWREKFLSQNPFIPDNFNVDFVGHWPFGPSYAVVEHG